MKKALFAVLAAFSLSACDFDIQKLPSQVADTVGGWIDSIKDLVTGGGEKEKEKEEEEEQPCEHQDADHDGVCDLCGEQGLVVTHIDANNDHLCDVCGAEVSQCKDDNHDHICDICGATVSTCKDENNDFKCDICGKDLAAVSFELDTSAATTEFAKGQEFSAAGLKVIVTSEVGSKQELSGESLTVEAPSTEEVGEKVVSVSYEFAGVSHSDEYKINVTYWSEDDLELFAAGVTFTRYADALPYLAGFNMRTEYVLNEDKEITDWSIVADNISDEALLEYVNMLASYESVASLSSKEVTFKLNSVAGNYEGLFDLSDVNVFSLIPYYVDNKGNNERFFVNDEYIAVGINAQGQLVLKNRFNNAMLDGMFFGDEYADGTYYFPAAYNSYLNYLPEILGYYYSELSPEAFLLPSLAADVYIVPINLVSVYPFEESLDAYDLAWFVELGNAKEQCYLDYCDALEAAGFEAEALENGRTSYSFSDPLYGYFEIIPGYDAEAELSDGSIGEEVFFSFYYIAPDSYTNHLDLEILEVASKLGISVEEFDNEEYEDYGRVSAFGSYAKEGISDGLEAAKSVARGFIAEGFSILAQFDYSETYKQYYFSVASEDLFISVYVDETAKEDGSFGVEFYARAAKDGENELSNAERALQAAFYAYTQGQALALKGVDYTENEDGSFTTIIPVPNATAANLEYACTTVVGSLLGSSFEVDSSAAGEGEGTWVTVFKDTANNVLVTVTGTAVESGLVLSIVFENHAFITPESTMIDFLTAASGSAPQEGAYTVNAEDGSCVAKSSIAGQFTADDLAGLAGQVAQFLPEGFEAGEAGAASESSYVAYFSNEETNIECTITVSLGEAGADVEVKFGFIPEVVQIRADEQAMIDILTALWGAVEDGDYKYNEEQDMYVAGFYIFNSSYADEGYNQPIASFLAGKAPSSFTIVQQGAKTVSGINAYQIIMYDSSTGCVIQITVLVHPQAGKNVFQILTYLNA